MSRHAFDYNHIMTETESVSSKISFAEMLYRRVYSNGTLEVVPARAGAEPAALVVRCRAANAHGVALSRDVMLQPASEARWEAAASAAPAAAGGVAALACRASALRGHVRPALWYRADSLIHLAPPRPGEHTMRATCCITPSL